MTKFLGSLLLAAIVVPALASEPVPDFKLVDVNSNSARGMSEVSPRDYVLQVSGYYFGAAG
ncbi:MAG: hypothetical protein FJ403_03085 [Verrucomicrobia bacterium]|nr:hypothetical protein [Verrucomicrobiota bacterium]